MVVSFLNMSAESALVLNTGRARDRLHLGVWTEDLRFVKADACVGLCRLVAVWTGWRLVLVFTLTGEDVFVPFCVRKR
jgi:hypothetical protein